MYELVKPVVLLILVVLAVQTAVVAAGTMHFDDRSDPVAVLDDASATEAGASGHLDSGCHMAAHLLGVAGTVAISPSARKVAPNADYGFSVRTNPSTPAIPPPIL